MLVQSSWNPARWHAGYLRSKACGEGNAGMNVSGTVFAPYPSVSMLVWPSNSAQHASLGVISNF